jgi:hypothetical protein
MSTKCAATYVPGLTLGKNDGDCPAGVSGVSRASITGCNWQ